MKLHWHKLRIPTDEAIKSIYDNVNTADEYLLNCRIAGLFLSSIYNKKALIFHENKTFDIVKEKKRGGKCNFWRLSNLEAN